MTMTEGAQARYDDEKAIKQLVDEWLTATRKGDLATVLRLMSDDVIFMVPGMEPFGKKEFAENSKQMEHHKIEAVSDIKEIEVLGDRAWMRNHLQLTITQPNGESIEKSGYILSILRKNSDGAWVLARDANLLT